MARGNFRDKETNSLEERGKKFLDKFTKFNVQRNNLSQKNLPDYINEDGNFIDFQFSKNFGKYGDFRVDLISAYTFPEIKSPSELDLKSKESLTCLLNGNISNDQDVFDFISQHFNINKKGKYFEEENLTHVLFFIYNSGQPDLSKESFPDKVFLINKQDLLDYLSKFIKSLIRNVKTNHKVDVNDIHGSMFLPISLNHFIQEQKYQKGIFKPSNNSNPIEIIVENRDLLQEKTIEKFNVLFKDKKESHNYKNNTNQTNYRK